MYYYEKKNPPALCFHKNVINKHKPINTGMQLILKRLTINNSSQANCTDPNYTISETDLDIF